MMHYKKGENIEREIKKEELPFEDCLPNWPIDFLWMHVKGGTKVNNVVTFAKNALEKGEHRTLVWTGIGGGLVKTVSCAEIIKRSFPLYQVTKMSYTNIEEHWLPQMEGLDEIVVNRKIPCIHILMSLDEIDENVNGLQKPNTSTNFFGDKKAQNLHTQRLHGRSGGAHQHNRTGNQYAGKNEQHQQSTKYQRPKKPKTTNKGQERQKDSTQNDGQDQKRHRNEKTLESKASAENSSMS